MRQITKLKSPGFFGQGIIVFAYLQNKNVKIDSDKYRRVYQSQKLKKDNIKIKL